MTRSYWGAPRLNVILVTLDTTRADRMASHLVCFSVTDRSKHPLLNEQFAKDKVIVKGVGIEGIDYRITCHLYNTEKDINRFGDSLHKVLGKA